MWPPLLPSQYPNIHLRFRRSSGLADPKSPNPTPLCIYAALDPGLFFSDRATRDHFLPYDHTNKTRLAEAPFGLVGDDNGPGSEPPPRNRIGIATAFMPSRRRSPAAPGKPSFPYFKADYLPRRRVRFEPSQRSFDIDYSMMRGRIGDPKASTPISGNRGRSKQPRADAPFGPDGDDNGPGSEPPPQDRIGLFMAVMPSRRRPPAAVGKPSFPYFKADYLPDDVCRPRRPTIFRHRISATRWRTKDPKAWAQTAGIRRVVPSNPRRRRRIPSISSCCRNNFGRESDHSTYVVARSGKKSPKSAAIAYHFVREGCVKDAWRTHYIDTNHNVADLFTKALPSGEKRWRFVSYLLAYVAPKQFYPTT
ncbi:hypothetical protein THAOC_18493 [Thalassiosira oceanica]|uniref:Uncharacterized protein n=1 Tax=Thalassiosira oceanica TaxID=159749 RepID=K0S4M7_THAOC|nr:hypothetical protein THAOC_18493 [Thalassiosira oceanica]|eukprot:EJK61073.1 hypothetical protein THAOC_18493 [Thalassiosira oceanica]